MVHVSVSLNVVLNGHQNTIMKGEMLPGIVTHCHRDTTVRYPPASADIYIENSLLTSRELSSVVTLSPQVGHWSLKQDDGPRPELCQQLETQL